MPKEAVDRVSVTEAIFGEAIAALMDDALFAGKGREHERNCAAAAMRYVLARMHNRGFCSDGQREATVKKIATLETT